MYEKFPIAFDTITLQTKEKLKFLGNSMNAFEKVIGYETVKNELMQICDMVHNKERYEALGARMPKWVLNHGEPVNTRKPSLCVLG